MHSAHAFNPSQILPTPLTFTFYFPFSVYSDEVKNIEWYKLVDDLASAARYDAIF